VADSLFVRLVDSDEPLMVTLVFVISPRFIEYFVYLNSVLLEVDDLCAVPLHMRVTRKPNSFSIIRVSVG
jgi:hypothetical protein